MQLLILLVSERLYDNNFDSQLLCFKSNIAQWLWINANVLTEQIIPMIFMKFYPSEKISLQNLGKNNKWLWRNKSENIVAIKPKEAQAHTVMHLVKK